MVLIGLVALSCTITLSISGFAVLCHVQSVKRGREHYLALLDPIFFDKNNYTEYAGADDFVSNTV